MLCCTLLCALKQFSHQLRDKNKKNSGRPFDLLKINRFQVSKRKRWLIWWSSLCDRALLSKQGERASARVGSVVHPPLQTESVSQSKQVGDRKIVLTHIIYEPPVHFLIKPLKFEQNCEWLINYTLLNAGIGTTKPNWDHSNLPKSRTLQKLR